MQSYHPYHSSLKTHALLQNNMNAKMRLSPSRILSCFVSLHKAETFVPDLWYLFNIRIGFSILLDCSSFFSIGPGDSHLTFTQRFLQECLSYHPYTEDSISCISNGLIPSSSRTPFYLMSICLLFFVLMMLSYHGFLYLSTLFFIIFSIFLFLFFCPVFSLLIFVLF